MNKILKKISYALSTFVIGAQSKIFARNAPLVYGPPPEPENTITGRIVDLNQTDIYGPMPDPINTNSAVNIDQPAIYGPAPDPRTATTGLGQGQILSILVAFVLFMIGIAVALNKGITKKVKNIVIIIISLIILAIILLNILVFKG